MDCRHVQGQTLADLAPKDLQARVMPDMSWEANVQRLAVQLLEVRLITLHHLRSWQLMLCTTSRLAAKHMCVCLQTVGMLHARTKYAHLNITNSSIVLLEQPKHAWDDIKLMNFDFAKQGELGTHCELL